MTDTTKTTKTPTDRIIARAEKAVGHSLHPSAWLVRMRVQVSSGDEWLAEEFDVIANNEANAIRAAYAKAADHLPSAVGFIAAFKIEDATPHTIIDRLLPPKRLSWGERRALGVEYDELFENRRGRDYEAPTDEQGDRMREIDEILEANPLDSYTSEEIDKYNVEHFGNASGRVQEGA